MVHRKEFRSVCWREKKEMKMGIFSVLIVDCFQSGSNCFCFLSMSDTSTWSVSRCLLQTANRLLMTY